MVKRFADLVAESAMPLDILSRDGKTRLLSIDCRDTVTPALLNARAGLSTGNMLEIGKHQWEAEELMRNAGHPWLGILFMHGHDQPSKSQIAALRYAAEQGSWFVNPRNRLFNRNTVLICTERGWLAEDGKELRITAEGRRMLRNAALDEEDARQNPPRRYRKRDRGGAGI